MSIKEKIIREKLPKHIAIIMDGNGRWAKQKGNIRIFGHKNGVKAVRATTEACAELGVSYLTLYAFSSENWKRPKQEVLALMDLLTNSINKETHTLLKNDIRLNTIGNIQLLPENIRKRLNEAMDKTSKNSRLTLTLALSYSSKEEILQAAKKMISDTTKKTLLVENINEQTFEKYLFTHNLPNPDLLIRTGGEQRISNFLLWQMAYSELYFTKVFWPDFDKEELYRAILEYQHRERRFGKISEQINLE